MKELKSDHHAGKISDEKYEELSQKYMLKLKNIDATSKIRAMQGRRQVNNFNNKTFDKRQAELSRREDEKLVEKYIVNPKRVTNNKEKSVPESTNKSKYSIIAVIFLILAFSAGIGYGVLNFDFNSVVASHASAVVTDSAFPVVISNTTNVSTASSGTSASASGTSGSGSTTGTTSSPSTTSGSGDSGSGDSGSGDSGDSGSGGSGDSGSGGSGDSGSGGSGSGDGGSGA